MKNLVLTLLIFLSFVGCKKTNDFEGISLENPYDISSSSYISVLEAEEVNCEIIKMKLQVNDNRFPDTLNYTHILIKNPSNEATKTAQLERVFVKATCTTSTKFRMTLYNEITGLESIPSLYTYKP